MPLEEPNSGSRRSSAAIFSAGPAEDAAYANIRDAVSEEAKVCRIFTQELWAQFRPHADKHFLTEIRRDFHARFWEMYLTCSLLQHGSAGGYSVSCPKPTGPDILIEHQGRRIWIEAITATDGQQRKPDSIRLPPLGTGSSVPDEKIILRYSAAIEAKHRKLQGYLSKGVVSNTDSYVIAVNAYALAYRWADAGIPRILKAVLPVGALRFLFDRDTGKITGSEHQFRPNIYKANGAEVSTELFTKDEGRGISAVMHSCANAYMTTRPLGMDFMLIHNPMATNPVPHRLIKTGREYSVRAVQHGFELDCHEASR